MQSYFFRYLLQNFVKTNLITVLCVCTILTTVYYEVHFGLFKNKKMNERKNYTEKNPLYSVDHLRFVYVQLFIHQLLKAEPENGQSIHFDEECVTRKIYI